MRGSIRLSPAFERCETLSLQFEVFNHLLLCHMTFRG